MMEIKQLLNNEKDEALLFVKRVFIESEDDSYTKKGIETFCNFVDNKKITKSFKVYGAFEDNVLKGIIATDSPKKHICLFFVDKVNGLAVSQLVFVVHVLRVGCPSEIVYALCDEVPRFGSGFGSRYFHALIFIAKTYFVRVFFFGFDQLLSLLLPDATGYGLQVHFDAISRGVLDTRNIIYFLSIILFFIYLTTLSLKAYKR